MVAQSNTSITQQLQQADALLLEKKYTEALKLYESCAEQGNGSALAKLGVIYGEGFGVALDPQKSIDYFKQSVEKNSALGLVWMSYYETPKKAEEYILRAVELKETLKADAISQNSLAYIYRSEYSGITDYKEAFKWSKQSMDGGYLGGLNNVGVLYFIGKGVKKDKDKAFEHFLKAAEEGYVHAQCNMGEHYYYEKDYKEALK